MKLLVTANWLGFNELEKFCERNLSLHLGDHYPHNAQNCLVFAESFNLPKLQLRCLEILKRKDADYSDEKLESTAVATMEDNL